MSLLTWELSYLSGTLPPAWGDGSFPALQQLQIGAGISGSNLLSGTLPPEWGGPSAFQNLGVLIIANCTIHGRAVLLIWWQLFFCVRAFGWNTHCGSASVHSCLHRCCSLCNDGLCLCLQCLCVNAHLSLHAWPCVCLQITWRQVIH